jgi:hypothetical protein
MAHRVRHGQLAAATVRHWSAHGERSLAADPKVQHLVTELAMTRAVEMNLYIANALVEKEFE